MRARASCGTGKIGTVQTIADVERGLVRRRHQDHSPPHHVADRTSEIRVVRTPEQESVDVGSSYRREQSFGEDQDLIAVGLAALDELDESRTGGPGQGDR